MLETGARVALLFVVVISAKLILFGVSQNRNSSSFGKEHSVFIPFTETGKANDEKYPYSVDFKHNSALLTYTGETHNANSENEIKYYKIKKYHGGEIPMSLYNYKDIPKAPDIPEEVKSGKKKLKPKKGHKPFPVKIVGPATTNDRHIVMVGTHKNQRHERETPTYQIYQSVEENTKRKSRYLV